MLQFTVYCSEAFKIQETPFSLFQSQLKNGNHKHPKKKNIPHFIPVIVGLHTVLYMHLLDMSKYVIKRQLFSAFSIQD